MLAPVDLSCSRKVKALFAHLLLFYNIQTPLIFIYTLFGWPLDTPTRPMLASLNLVEIWPISAVRYRCPNLFSCSTVAVAAAVTSTLTFHNIGFFSSLTGAEDSRDT